MRNPLNSLSRDGGGPWIGTWTNSRETRVGSHPRPSSPSSNGKGEYIYMGSLIFIAVTALLILTGCLEGQYRGPDYSYGGGGGSSMTYSAAWYPQANSKSFEEPLGYPTTGAFAKDVTRASVASEAEFIAAIENQTGSLVITLVDDVLLTKEVRVRHPLIIQTTREIGIPKSSLQFFDTSGPGAAGGLLVVDNTEYLAPEHCKGILLGETAEYYKQLFVRLQGNIQKPNLSLVSRAHLVLSLLDNAEKIKIRSHDRNSTIVIKGQNKILHDTQFDARVVFIGRSGILSSFDGPGSIAGNTAMFLNSYPTQSEAGYLPSSQRRCYDVTALEAILKATYGESRYWVNIEYFGTNNQADCEENKWMSESRVRNLCTVSLPDSAAASGGAQ